MGEREWEQLREAVRACRRLLFESDGQVRPWDYLVLTAATEAQAEVFEGEIAERRARGLIPARTKTLVVPDPGGRRIGSGGATLHALRAVVHEIARERRARDAGEALRLLRRRRVVIVHCGGDSRRAPLLSATGKVFAHLPALLPDGFASTIFDELWALLKPLPARAGPCLLVTAGDVLLAFDPWSVSWPEAEVCGLACWAEAATGARHGVYLCEESGRVTGFLQKASASRLRRAGAVERGGRVRVDSGLLLFRAQALRGLAELACGVGAGGGKLSEQAAEAVWDGEQPLSLYEDFVSVLLPEGFEPSARGQAQGEGETPARAALARALGGCRFCVAVPEPSLFVHLGTTRQLVEHLTRDRAVRRIYELRQVAEARTGACKLSRSARLYLSYMRDSGRVEAQALVHATDAEGGVRVGRRAILAGVSVHGEAVTVRDEVVLSAVPVRYGDNGAVRRGTAYLVYGIGDDPREPLESERCTFAGEPLREWLRRRRIPQRAVWPDVPPGKRALWNAKLFPVVQDGGGDGLRQVLWMQEKSAPAGELVRSWLKRRRVSFSELPALVDAEKVHERALALHAKTAAAEIIEDAEARGNLHIAGCLLRLPPRTRARAMCLLADYAQSARDPLARCRVVKALGDVLREGGGEVLEQRAVRAALGKLSVEAAAGRRRGGSAARQAARALESAAFDLVGEAIARETPRIIAAPRRAVGFDQCVVTEAPVRVDLAGGWTDTPPYCLEQGGNVLNVALNVSGAAPIRVVARPLKEPVVRLVSEDQHVALQTRRVGPLLSYARPGDALSLPKAALVRLGIVREGGGMLREMLEEFGGGIELRVRCAVPKGSGLGASSIVGAALVACLARLCGRRLTRQELFNEVLMLEQMLGTGGGWQDQVGGAIGGVKFICSAPGAGQKLRVSKIKLDEEFARALSERMLLVDTGLTRVARDILRVIMGRYISREGQAVRALSKIRENGRKMYEAFCAGDVERVGELMTAQWECNKQLDPESTNDAIERLFHAIKQYATGYKLAGAGGGGFAVILCREGKREQARRALQRLKTGAKVRVFDFEINEQGLRTGVFPAGEAK